MDLPRRKSTWLQVDQLDKKYEDCLEKRGHEEDELEQKRLMRVRNRRKDQRNRFHRKQQHNFQREQQLGIAQREAPTSVDKDFQPHESWRARQKKDWRFYRRTGNLWDDPYHIPPERRKIVIHRNMLEAEVQYIEKVTQQVADEEQQERAQSQARIQSIRDMESRLKKANFKKNHGTRSLSTHNLMTVARPHTSPGLRSSFFEDIVQYQSRTAPLEQENVRRASMRASSTPTRSHSTSHRLNSLSQPKIVKPRLELFKDGSNDFRGLFMVDRAMSDLIQDFEKSKILGSEVLGQAKAPDASSRPRNNSHDIASDHPKKDRKHLKSGNYGHKNDLKHNHSRNGVLGHHTR